MPEICFGRGHFRRSCRQGEVVFAWETACWTLGRRDAGGVSMGEKNEEGSYAFGSLGCTGCSGCSSTNWGLTVDISSALTFLTLSLLLSLFVSLLGLITTYNMLVHPRPRTWYYLRRKLRRLDLRFFSSLAAGLGSSAPAGRVVGWPVSVFGGLRGLYSLYSGVLV